MPLLGEVRVAGEEILMLFKLHILSYILRSRVIYQNFILQLIWLSPRRIQREQMQVETAPLQHLKVVEMIGYFGRTSDVEFADYLFRNAISLKSFIIDPRSPVPDQAPFNNVLRLTEDAKREAKEELERIKPQAVELIVR